MQKEEILNFIKERMASRNLSEFQLAELTGINRSIINRNFKDENEMTLSTLLKILVALEIRPYLVPEEMDKNEIQNFFLAETKF